MENIHDFYTKMEEGNIMLSFKGEVTSDLLTSILQIMESKMDTLEEPPVVKKKVYNILVECLQNLYHHLESDDLTTPINEKSALFMIKKQNDEYSIMTGNYMVKDNVEPMKKRLDTINAMDSLQLKTYYKEVLNNGEMSSKGGGGLGMIDIARKSGKKLEYRFDNVDDKLTFFSLNVKVAQNKNKEEKEEKEEEKLKYPKKVLEKIQHLKDHFSLHEICVLTRTRNEGVAVASYLSENGIDIISSETLLLQNYAKVLFIISVLKVLKNPNDEEIRFEILYFLYHHLEVKESKTSFFKELSKADHKSIINSLKDYGVSFEVSSFHQLPFYEKIEEIIRGFNLVKSSDAYIQFFLDIVLEEQRKGTDISEFLEFWEQKKERLSIVAPESASAVQIMTIHKSKGLEFPVVIFPSDVDVYRQLKPKSWLDELPEMYDGFKELLVDYSKNLSIVSERGLAIYNQQREALELDNFNLLYVTLTRAVEQLSLIHI